MRCCGGVRARVFELLDGKDIELFRKAFHLGGGLRGEISALLLARGAHGGDIAELARGRVTTISVADHGMGVVRQGWFRFATGHAGSPSALLFLNDIEDIQWWYRHGSLREGRGTRA